MANSNSPASKRARAQANREWQKKLRASGEAKNKSFFLRGEQIELVESTLRSINPDSQVLALVELCKKYNAEK